MSYRLTEFASVRPRAWTAAIAICLLVGCGSSGPSDAPEKVNSTESSASVFTDPVGAKEPNDSVASDTLKGDGVANASDPVANALPALLQPDSSTVELIAEGETLAEWLASQFPEDPDALEMAARFHASLGNADMARQIWSELLAKHADYHYAITGLADLHSKEGRLQEAVQMYERALKVNQGDPQAAIRLAKCLSELGQFDKAESVLARAVDRFPDVFAASSELGAVHLQLRDYESAVAAFQRAYRLRRDDPNSLIGLAMAHARLGNRDEAKLWQERHRECRKKERAALSRARVEYDDAQAIREDLANIYVGIANILGKHARQADYSKVVEHAAEISPTHRGSREMLLRDAQRAANTTEIQRRLEELVAIDDSDFQLLMQLAMVHAQSGRLATTEELVQDFVRRYPNHDTALLSLAQFYVDVKPDLPKAVDLAKRAAAITQSGADYLFLANLLVKVGELDKALEATGKATELGEDDAQVKASAARLREQIVKRQQVEPSKQ